MVYINDTNLTEANNVYTYTKAINEASSGYLGVSIIFTIFIILLIVFMYRGFKEAFLGSSAITSLIATGLFFLELIPLKVLFIPLMILFISIVVFLLTDR